MKLFPIVHVGEVSIAVEQANHAFELGADGVYLIDHGRYFANTKPLFDTFNTLKTNTPEHYVGLNILGLGPHDALHSIAVAARMTDLISSPDAVWVDDMRADEFPDVGMEYKQRTAEIATVRILGGICFKYTETFTEDPVEAADETLALLGAVDVVTTSGRGTGTEPSVAKIMAMKQVSGEKPLAVASGIAIENIHKYEGIVDEVLAATSVETQRGSGTFDQARLRDLIQAAHSLVD